jgi:putative ABC transport system permease protein
LTENWESLTRNQKLETRNRSENMDRLLQDLRYGTRMLLKQPGFALISVVTIALGIGANTAIFSVVNAVLLRPLPYQEPERLVKVIQSNTNPGKFATTSLWSYPRFAALRDQNESFSGVAMYCKRALNLTGTPEPEHLQAEFVSADYFPLLGIEAAIGRTFLPDEDKTPGGNAVAVVSFGFWQRRLGADPEAVGKTIELDKHRLTIVGVLPRGFKGQSGVVDVWMPTMMATVLLSPHLLTQPRLYWAEVIARLRPGVAKEQAQGEMNLLYERIEKLFPGPTGSRPSGSGRETFALVSLKDANVDPAIRSSFLILLAAVGFVLLIACANTAGLLLARAVSRRREFAVRLALGATRRRIISQLLTESMLLSMMGGVLGVLVAMWGVDLLKTFKPSDSAQFWTAYARTFDFYSVGLDGTVLAFNFLLAVVTGLLFGFIPALQASRADVNEALKDGSSGMRAGLNRRLNVRSILIVGEIALSLVLLAGAGLMINSLLRLNAIELGFEPKDVLSMTVYARDAKVGFYEQLLERASQLPGVEDAAVASGAPLMGSASMSPLEIEGRPKADGKEPGFVSVQSIAPSYFSTLRIGLQRGRGFTQQDRIGAKRVAIINQAAAQRFFPDEDPIGKRIKIYLTPGYQTSDEYIEIVGIANDVKYRRIEELPGLDLYLPYLQPVDTPSLLIVRASGDRQSLVSALRREVGALDRNMPVYDVKTMSERAAEVTSRTRFSAVLLALFAGLALILSAIGIYGVMAYTVAQRTREIGIRMALGAQAEDVIRLVLGDAIILTFAGLASGLGAAYAATRLLANQLYGVSATDPITFAVISVVVIGMALAACFVPARRATKVDPMVALRYE